MIDMTWKGLEWPYGNSVRYKCTCTHCLMIKTAENSMTTRLFSPEQIDKGSKSTRKVGVKIRPFVHGRIYKMWPRWPCFRLDYLNNCEYSYCRGFVCTVDLFVLFRYFLHFHCLLLLLCGKYIGWNDVTYLWSQYDRHFVGQHGRTVHS